MARVQDTGHLINWMDSNIAQSKEFVQKVCFFGWPRTKTMLTYRRRSMRPRWRAASAWKRTSWVSVASRTTTSPCNGAARPQSCYGLSSLRDARLGQIRNRRTRRNTGKAKAGDRPRIFGSRRRLVGEGARAFWSAPTTWQRTSKTMAEFSTSPSGSDASTNSVEIKYVAG
jgi:hypothetical protein